MSYNLCPLLGRRRSAPDTPARHFVPAFVTNSLITIDFTYTNGGGTALAMPLSTRSSMELSRYSLAITITGTLTVLAASMLVWLLLTEPVALATAVGDHDLTALAQAVGHALAATFKAIARYL